MTSPRSRPESAPPAPVTSRRATIAAFSGAFLEWYDFWIFGTAAALVFPRVFFPEASPTVALLQSFGTFAVAFVTRPLGAIIFGHFGDKVGRKPVLLVTVFLIGGGTFLMGVLPSYAVAGSLGAVLLILLRLVQGIGIGGEYGGGSLLALENAPKGKRGLAGSFHQLGTPAALLASTGIFALVEQLPEDQLLSWGWRIPFLLSGPFLALGFYIRKNLPETSAFRADAQSERKSPFLALLREQPKAVLLGIGARMADAVTFNIINVFAVSWVTTYLGMSSDLILAGFVISSAVQLAVLPLAGRISDRIGRRPVYLTGIAICAVGGGLLYFPIIAMGNAFSTWAIIVVVHAIGTGLMFSIQSALFAELFGTRVRYTGLGVVYQGSALIGGGPTPAIAVGLTALAGSWWPAGAYLVLACVISALCIWRAGETFRNDLADTTGGEPVAADGSGSGRTVTA
ncbi:MFS transporter [Isoptericola cucumis]|uniref:MFS transporter n=1 Tax=Isoptericola cucumis TaxID=1776856 RepID=A0ABQ2B0C9_9MICO|nr:MFS transporter [Isoptericola cucumis]GGI04810.1 MFS transporter [Isoptericola cucumis]